MSDLPTDPGRRTPISCYNPNDQDEIRRHYLLQEPCQPRLQKFPPALYGKVKFNTSWYETYSSWLEYSINKDSLFCLYCYLFKQNNGKQAGGDTFVRIGFRN